MGGTLRGLAPACERRAEGPTGKNSEPPDLVALDEDDEERMLNEAKY